MDEYTLPFNRLGKGNVSIAGGKGAQLGEMTRAGIPVPPGFVVLTSSFKAFISENEFGDRIAKALSSVNPKDTASIDKASKTLREVIIGGKVSKGISDAILGSFDKLGARFVAVRSSATAEDAASASWAGELETYLNVELAGLMDAVKRCWSSLFTPRAIFYRFEKKLDHDTVSVAVVVQKMVQSEVAGVVFTVNPVTKDMGQIVIEAGYGLGESVVAGKITPDNYVVDKNDMTIMDVNVSEQDKMLVKSKGGNAEVDVPANKKSSQKLSGKDIIRLAEICKSIEKHYGKPQDIEFAFENNELYIVQSRPVTTL